MKETLQYVFQIALCGLFILIAGMAACEVYKLFMVGWEFAK